MGVAAKAERAAFYLMKWVLSPISPRLCTRFMLVYYRRNGMRILGDPNYLSARIWFDGTDYSMIELGEGCTISSFVRILTHDWSPHTIARGMGILAPEPLGIFRNVRVGRYAFVGTWSVLLPGADIGEGALIGAGSVVRGVVPPWSVVAGNPAEVVGDSREFVGRYLRKRGLEGLTPRAGSGTGGTGGPNA